MDFCNELQYLISDCSTFFEKFWRSQPWLSRRLFSRDRPNIFPLQVFETMLSYGDWRVPNLRAYRDGSLVSGDLYSGTREYAGSKIHHAVSINELLRILSDGGSVVLQNVEKYSSSLAMFCADLEYWFGHQVHLTAFVTMPGGLGLPEHSDPVDVFVLQTHGSRRWFLEAPSGPEREIRRQEYHISTGDCLYIPQGRVHQPAPADGLSLHLSICIHTVAWREAIVGYLMASERFSELRKEFARSVTMPKRMTIPEDMKNRFDELLSELPRRATDTSFNDYLKSDFLSRSLRREHNRLEVTAADGARWRKKNLQCLVHWTSESGTLEFNGKRITMSAKFKKAIGVILEGKPFAAVELPGLLTIKAKNQLATQLEREGLLIQTA